MHRIDSQGAIASLPTANAPGALAGFFQNAAPAPGVNSTYFDPDWCNAIQEEIVGVILASGQMLTKGNYTQLLQAIKLVAGGGATGPRVRLTSNITLYVSPAGNDTTGNGTSGAPWQTIQAATNYLAANIDFCQRYTATIQCANGSYAPFALSTPWVGGSPLSVIVNGDSASPTSVMITAATANTAACAAHGGGVGLMIQNCALYSSIYHDVVAAEGAEVLIGTGVAFGTAGQAHILAINGGIVSLAGNYSIIGGALYHYLANGRGHVSMSPTSITVMLTGSPAFSTGFATAVDLGLITAPSSNLTFVGGATGPRYSATNNAVIDTALSGASFFPGTAPGSTGSGGIYV